MVGRFGTVFGAVTFLGLDATQWQAIGTVALVGVTIAYVVLTGRLSGYAKSSADSAEKSADSSARSATAALRGVQLAVMPIVVGRVVAPGPGVTGTVVECLKLTDAPAFGLIVEVKQKNPEERAESGWGSKLIAEIHGSSGTVHTVPMPIAHRVFPNTPYDIEIVYMDALGTTYRTERLGYSDPDVYEFRILQLDRSTMTWEVLMEIPRDSGTAGP